ncbi:MAG TPA: NRDE family protein [Alphaproteobacteria bacterium]|nr:NRDE family protein [Alphaproteobacteria bacterium]
MCTLVLLRRPGHAWPLLAAANRDEMAGRPWRPPGRHWPDRPEAVAGLDELAGGSWLGLNDWGVMAAVLNRAGSLGPAPDKRSRGELVLEALDHADAFQAAKALMDLDPRAYREFNLVVADNRNAYWLAHRGDGAMALEKLPPGVSMITAHDRNDAARSARTRRYLPLFEAAAPPDPDGGDWAAWQALLGSRESDGGPEGALCIATDFGFATTSSSLIALPSAERTEAAPVWLFAAGSPDAAEYRPVAAGGAGPA